MTPTIYDCYLCFLAGMFIAWAIWGQRPIEHADEHADEYSSPTEEYYGFRTP